LFKGSFKVLKTPSALASGGSQLKQIAELIGKCVFGVVILDGLRPNVVFEYGMLFAKGRPVIVLKETEALVDVASYFGDAPSLNLPQVKIDLDKHCSDIKDQTFSPWRRHFMRDTLEVLWSEYQKKKSELKGSFVEIPKPELW